MNRTESARRLLLTAMRFSGSAKLATRFFGGRGVILMLHRVTDQHRTRLDLNGHLVVSPSYLDEVLTELRRLDYDLVSMDQAIRRLKQPATGRRFVAMTLDDGYRDNLVEALPVFEKHSVPFTVYISPGLIYGETELWWEWLEAAVTFLNHVSIGVGAGMKRWETRTRPQKIKAFKALLKLFSTQVLEEKQIEIIEQIKSSLRKAGHRPETSPLMSWREIQQLARHPLCTIGAHSQHHYALRRLDEATAYREISDSLDTLQGKLGLRSAHFAYPYGYESAVGPREAKLAKEAGIVSAVTTRHGLIQAEHIDHLHELPRLSINGRFQSLGHLRTLLSGLTVALANRGRLVVTL